MSMAPPNIKVYYQFAKIHNSLFTPKSVIIFGPGLCFIQPKLYVLTLIWLNKIFYSAKTGYFYGHLAE